MWSQNNKGQGAAGNPENVGGHIYHNDKHSVWDTGVVALVKRA